MNRDSAEEPWRCVMCGELHAGLVRGFGPLHPDPWANASEDERASGEINQDTCVLHADGKHYFFVRGVLEIPVHDPEIGTFAWSVWVRLAGSSAKATIEHWNDADRVSLPPMPGQLANWLMPYEPPTIDLPVHLYTRELGVAPLFMLDPSVDHPLVREQVEGISVHRLAELNLLLLGS